MIIEDLKYLWDEESSPAAQTRWNEAEIQDMVKKRSRSTLSKINRNILLEMGFVAFLCLMMIWGLFQTEEPQTSNFIRVIAYVFFSAAFYAIKFYLLNRAKLGTHNLKESLQKTTKVLGVYMKIYKSIVYFVPLFFIYGLFMGMESKGASPADISMARWAIIIGITIVVSAGLYFVFRWYIKLVYGNHYENLKASLKELEID